MTGTAKDLARKLREIRDEMAYQPWRQRRDAMHHCLEHELRELPRAQIGGALAAVRKELQRADGSGSDHGELQAEIKNLQAERERLLQERDRLRRELAATSDAAGQADQLRQENERLRQTLTDLRRSKTDSGVPGGVRTLRGGFIRCLDTATAPDPGELGLDGPSAALFRAVCEVLNFARNYDLGLNSLILDISGKLDSHGTTMAVMTRKVFRKRFVESLEGDEESMNRLKETMKSNLRFLLMLNDAYLSCLRPGVQGVLGELDPQETLVKHKKLLHYDYDGAFKSLQRDHGDLTNLTRDELWESYFSKTVRRKLGDYLEDLDAM